MTRASMEGRVNGQGALIAADAEFLRLQQSVGADIGSAIAMPQLARLVTRALRQRRDVRQAVMLADQNVNIRGWALISPDADGAEIILRSLASTAIREERGCESGLHFPSLTAWEWETDAGLNLIALRAGKNAYPMPEQWAGRSLRDLFYFDAGEDDVKAALSAQWQQSTFFERRAAIRNDEGLGREVMLTGGPIVDGRGAIRGFRGSAELIAAPEGELGLNLRDVHESGVEFHFNKRVEDALRLPINRIIFAAETIAEGCEGRAKSDYGRYAGDIAEAGRHLLGLVDDLVDVKNIETPGFSVAADPIDLAEIANSAVGMLALKAADKNIHITMADPDVHVPVTGEHRRVMQILINLLTNAVRYSPENTIIRVEMDCGLMESELSVVDQGCGLSPEQQDLIFEKFERLGRRDSGGSGLGLYIARKLARAMRGDLRVESTLGLGSRFTLSVPTRVN